MQSAAPHQHDPDHPLAAVIAIRSDVELHPAEPEDFIGLDWRGPLDAIGDIYPTALRGGIVSDPDEIAAIRRRVKATAASPGAWRRVLRRIRTGR